MEEVQILKWSDYFEKKKRKKRKTKSKRNRRKSKSSQRSYFPVFGTSVMTFQDFNYGDGDGGFDGGGDGGGGE